MWSTIVAPRHEGGEDDINSGEFPHACRKSRKGFETAFYCGFFDLDRAWTQFDVSSEFRTAGSELKCFVLRWRPGTESNRRRQPFQGCFTDTVKWFEINASCRLTGACTGIIEYSLGRNRLFWVLRCSRIVPEVSLPLQLFDESMKPRTASYAF